MKKIYTIVTIAVVWILMASNTFGVPAYPHPAEYKLPDGTTITITLKGDEKVRWAETEDGYSILLNKDGYYEYAMLNDKGDMVRSSIRVKPIKERELSAQSFLSAIKKGLAFSPSQVNTMKQAWEIQSKEASKAFPTTGSRKLICILIGYTDLAFTKTQAEFNDLFNYVGYTTGGATGSVKDYYLENSYNQFNLTVDVAGPYTASNTMAYYGTNSPSDDYRVRDLVLEAINLADPHVNYADYDNDSDGSVDGLYIIYAGYGEENTGVSADAIWAHAWSITPVIRDGKTISRYSCSAELRGSSGTNITNIGVICHEFGHVLGAPDYYDTDYATGGSYSGTGTWDMMASGSWNNDGATPAHHNGFTKVVYYNWAAATELTSGATITLNNAAQYSNSFYKINTTTSGEYFLIENREKHLFDAYIPGSGMIIYRVHSGVFAVGNKINATHPQRMYPVAQNATSAIPTSTASTYGTINAATCAWTGTGKTAFTDASTPSMQSWAAANTNKPITNISRNAGAKTVTFDFMGGAQGNPINFTATGVSTSRIDLSWLLNTHNNPIVLAYSTTGTFGTPANGTSYSAGNSIPGGGTVLYSGSNLSYQHLSLTANTTYYYKIWSVLTGTNYSPGVAVNGTTLCGIVSSFPYSESFENGGSIPTCWTQEYVSGSRAWTFVTSNGTNPSAAQNGSYFGLFKNSSTTAEKTRLVTPAFDFTGKESATLKFWHQQALWSPDQDELRVFYKTTPSGSWVQLEAYTSNVTTWTQRTITLPNLSSTYFIAFEGTAKYGYGACLDNIEVTSVNQTIFPEPTDHPTTFLAGTSTSNSITITWNDATSKAQAPTGYLIKASTVSYAAIAVPVDGTPETDGTLVKNVAQGVQTVTFTGLNPSTTYYFKIFPYTNAGTNINYKTDGSVPQVSKATEAASCTYCIPTATTDDNTGITFVGFNTISNSSLGAPAYSDFTALSTSVVKGQSYDLSVRVNTDGNFTVHAMAWIDWDKSCTFDAGEAYNLGTATDETDGAISNSPLSISIPESVAPGSYTMRVRARYNTAPTACDNNNYSEAEDYTIVVVDPTPQYTLTINQTGNGTVNVNGAEYTIPVTVDENTVLNIEAIAESGWQFSSWTGAVANTAEATTTVTMDADKTITATFTEIPIVPTVLVGWNFPNTPDDQIADEATTANAGRTISRETGFAGTYSYVAGVSTSAISTTTWDDGAEAKYWLIDFSTSGFKDITISSKQKGSNTGPKNFKVQYRLDGTPWTDVPGAGVVVANDAFVSGVLANVALPSQATNQGKVYLRWIMTDNVSISGAVVASAGTSRIDDIVIKGLELASGVQKTLTLSKTGNGTINPVAGTYVYNTETEISVSATPEIGWQFDGWTGSVANASEATTTVTMDNDKAVNATFSEIPSTFAVNFSIVSSNGSLTATVDGIGISSGNNVLSGKSVVFTATPDGGFRVREWTLNGSTIPDNTSNTYTISSLSAAATVTVEFETIPLPTYAVNFSVDGANGSVAASVDGFAINSGDAVEEGKEVIFTATPNTFYTVAEWQINSAVVAGNTTNTLTINNLTEVTTISVGFELQSVGSVTATYTLGDIPTDLNFTALPGQSSCPGLLTVTIPENAYITAVDVVYDMTTYTIGWLSDQVSQLRCVSEGGLHESTVFYGTGDVGGTQNYSRSGLDIANNVSGGGGIQFELHAGRQYGGADCNFDFNVVDNASWSVTVHYQMDTPPQHTLTMLPVSGMGSVSPSVGDHVYIADRVISIGAHPALGWEFTSWLGDVANPNSAETTVTMDSDKSVQAVFTQLEIIPTELPYAMDFEDVADNSIPDGWYRTHGQWGVASSNFAGGTAPEMLLRRIPSMTGVTKVVSSKLIAETTNRIEIEFKHHSQRMDDASGTYTLALQSSTDGLNWTNQWSTIVNATIPAQTITSELQNLSGTEFYLAWAFTGFTYNGDWKIDDIYVKVEPNITPSATAITYGQTLASSTLSGTATYGETTVEGVFAFEDSNIEPVAGTYVANITFTPNEGNKYLPVSGTVNVTVNKAAVAVTIENLSFTYDGNPKQPTVTTNPEGYTVSVTYNDEPEVPVNAGVYEVIATVVDDNYAGSATETMTIHKATATVLLDNLTHIYDGTAKSATATTTPEGLTVEFTYDGFDEAPVDVDTYEVVATVNETNYEGSASGTLTINKATAAIVLSGLSHVYDGMGKSATATTTPEGLTVEYTYEGVATLPVNAGAYEVIATVVENNYSGTATDTLRISKATAIVNIANVEQTYDGAAKTVSVTTVPEGLTVAITYDGSADLPVGAGSYEVIATITDDNYQGSKTETLVVNKAMADIDITNLAHVYNGEAKSVAVSTVPEGLTVNVTYNGNAVAPINAGEYEVIALIDNANYQGTDTVTMVIDKATATVFVSALSHTYDGIAKSVEVTTEPEGLSVAITYNDETEVPVNAGVYEVIATVVDDNYAGSTTETMTIQKAAATVLLDNLTHIYDGMAKSATATTTPEGLTVDFTYDGFAEAPVNVDTYEVVATVNETNYEGSTTGTLTINKATAAIVLSGLSHVYDGTDKSATATTTPEGLTVEYTYEGVATLPVNAGAYEVIATVVENNYNGTATDTLRISKATATVNIANVEQTYDGAAKTVSVTTVPEGLTVAITYDGSAELPVGAGSYEVIATITDDNYQGSKTETLVVNKAMADLEITNLAHIYNGEAKSVAVSTVPEGLSVNVTYNGNAVAPINAGEYEVIALIDNANYQGTDTVTMVIDKATATVQLSSLIHVYDGEEKSAVVTTVPENLAIDVTYNDLALLPVNAGNYTVIATVLDNNYAGVAEDVLVIEKAVADIEISGLVYTYDGLSKSVTLSTAPEGLNVNVTYNELTSLPVNAGEYAVVAIIDEANYQGTATETLVINAAALTITANSFNKMLGQEYVFAGTEFTSTEMYGSDNVFSATITSDGAAAGAVMTDYPVVISNAVGNGLSNYDIEYVNGILTVTDKIILTLEGLTVADKVYDNTAAATVSEWGTLVGIEGEDVVTLNSSNYNATFNNERAGTNKAVTITGLVLEGVDANKYKINNQTALADITPRTLTLSGFSVANKIYNGTTATQGLDFEDNRVAGDILTLFMDAAFEDKNVGVDKTVSFFNIAITGGIDAQNYVLASTEGTAIATIFAREISIGGSFTALDKIVDGNTMATIDQNNLALVNYINGDDVGLVNVETAFASPEIADNIVVSIIDAQLTGTDAPNYALTLVGSPTTTANILPVPTYQLTLSVNPSDIGAVVTGAGVYEEGVETTISASTVTGYTFVGWSGSAEDVALLANANASSTTLAMPARMVELTANYTLNQHVVTAVVAPELSGTVTGTGSYGFNAEVTLTATPNTGFEFLNWRKNGSVFSNDNPLTFNMPDDNVSLTAFFVPEGTESYNVTLSAMPADGGTVSGVGEYAVGEEVVVSANINVGYAFVNWTNAANEIVSANAFYTFTMPTADVALTANFELVNYNVTASVNPENAGTVSGTGVYTINSEVVLTATANTGYTFVNWTNPANEIVSANAVYTFTMPTADVALTANFELVDYNVTAIVNPENAGTVTGTGMYNMGNEVTLTASTNIGYAFVNWTNAANEIVGTNAVYTFTMPAADVALTANFELVDFNVTATVNPENAGTVNGTGMYNMGNEVTLTASTNIGYAFVNWTNAANEEVSTNAVYTFTMPTADVALTANFRAKVSASINPTSGTFDESNPENLSTVITWNDATTVTSVVAMVEGEEYELAEGEEYTITDIDGETALLTFILADEKLKRFRSKEEMDIPVTINFDYGTPAVYTITFIWVDTYLVSFNVTDDNGQPLVGATITFEGIFLGLETDENGVATVELENGDYTFTVSKEGYISETESVTVSDNDVEINIQLSLVGISNISLTTVKLYPNPVVDVVNLERNTSERVTVEVYSNSGALVETLTWNTQTLQLNATDYKNGMFYIRVVGQQVENLRFIKQ